MAYIRVKRAKRKNGTICEYAYIVESKRFRKKKVRQKSKRYLGRVYRHDRANMVDFYEHYGVSDVSEYIKNRSKKGIVLDVIKLELHNHGFKEKRWIWEKDGCFVNLNKRKVHNEKGNPIALAFNEGFLTSYAIKKLINFKADYEEEGYDFAKMFVEAGLLIPKDVFVGVFNKVYKQSDVLIKK